jgi:hypothetical protein
MKSRHVCIALLFTLIGTMFLSCRLVASQPEIIAAGFFTDAFGAQHACYWRDGQRISLPDTGTFTSNATAVFAYGEDVYTAGFYYSTGTNRIACYWKNKERFDLICVPAPETKAVSIVYTRTSVRVAGENNGRPCFWEGQVPVDLPMTSPPLDNAPTGVGFVSGMRLAAGTAAYTLGSYQYSGGVQNCLWTDLAPVDLNLTTTAGQMTSLTVSDSNIYVAGSSLSLAGACYWKNMTPVALPIPPDAVSGSGLARSIQVANGIVYTAGEFTRGIFTFPCFWTGTARTELPLAPGGFGGSGLAIFEFQGNIYTAGMCAGGFGQAASPCYWINTMRVDLRRNDSNESHVNAIYVH